MPYDVVKNHPDCPDGKPYAVVKKTDGKGGKPFGCHATSDDAAAQIKAIEQSEASMTHDPFNGTHSHSHPTMGTQGGDATHDHEHTHANNANHDHHTAQAAVTAAAADDGAFHCYLTVEGLRTTDHRAIAANALTWRDLPLPLLWCQEGNGHSDSIIVGKIESIERQAEGKIYGTGHFDMAGEAGAEAARMCDEGLLRWVSVDMEVLDSELITIGGGGESSGDPFLDALFGPMPDEDEDWYEEVTSGRIMGAHMVAFPAFPQAVITPAATPLPEVEPMGTAPTVVPGLMACAALSAPPAEWFEDPHLSGASPLTVTTDGRVFGHLALWGSCHTGFPDACVCPPRSARGYAYAQTGRVRCANGAEIPVGQITMSTGHADLSASHRSAAAHYDDTGTAVADVCFGEDDNGIWFSGSLRPGVTDDQVRVLRASALSGDWRKIGGGLELVAALAVNVPGFPIVAGGAPGAFLGRPRAGLHADGDRREQVSLVAAGALRRGHLEVVMQQMHQLQTQVSQLERCMKPLLAASVERMGATMAKVQPPSVL